MTKLNKSEKIIKWASNHRNSFANKLKRELGYATDKQLMFLLNRMVRHGWINFEVTGRKIRLSLTKIAEANKYLLVA